MTKLEKRAIAQAFANADEVIFSARNYNYPKYPKITFGNLGYLRALDEILPLIGITPQMLRPIFAAYPQRVTVSRRFPFNLRWFGFNKQTTKQVSISIPETVTSFDELGGFPLEDWLFQKLAKILKKSIKVLRKDGSTGEHIYMFTVHTDGYITYNTSG